MPVTAVEITSRIIDREIIESLAENKAGQKHLRIKGSAFVFMQEQMDVRFTAVDQRFESIDQRLDLTGNLMLVLIAGLFGLIGFIAWDRYSILRPMDNALAANRIRSRT